jgi:hypothetical protein
MYMQRFFGRLRAAEERVQSFDFTNAVLKFLVPCEVNLSCELKRYWILVDSHIAVHEPSTNEPLLTEDLQDIRVTRDGGHRPRYRCDVL